MVSFFRVLCVILAATLMVACGGGGGGSSSSGGTPAPVVTDTLSLSAGAIDFSATEFEATPATISVTATVTGSNTAGIVFGTLPGVDSLPFWLNVELGTFANNSVDADFIITTTDIPEGDYSFTVRAVTVDSSEVVLDTADIVIRYAVAEGIPISISSESIDVEMHLGSDPISETVSVTAGNYEWSVFTTDANASPGTATGSQDVTLEIFPPMSDFVDENGLYTGVVDFLQNGTSNSAALEINFTIFPTLTSGSDDLFLNGVAGSSETHTADVNIIGQDLNWQASVDVDWLTLSETSGVILTDDSEIGTPEGNDFSITLDSSDLEEGSHNAIITVTAEADQSIDIPITVEIAPQELFPSKRGIALSETATTSALTAQIALNTNASRVANWAASSDQVWLAVTPSGTVDDMLIVTADPSLLIDETFSEAVITLTSPDEEISQSTSISVGFWKSALTPTDILVDAGDRGAEGLIVSDPVRPLAYFNAIETEISVVNVYSGVVENTIIPTGEVEGMAISDDGAFLYLLGRGDGEGFIQEVDLTSQTITSTWPYPNEPSNVVGDGILSFARISNDPYLFSWDGQAIDAETGELVTVFGQQVPGDPEGKNNVFCGNSDSSTNGTPAGVSCMDLVTAGFDGARITAENSRYASDLSGDIKLTQSGDRLYAFGFRTVNVLDASDMSLIATLSTIPEDFVEGSALGLDDNFHVTFANEGFIPTDPEDDMIDPSRFMKIYDTSLNEVATVDYPNDGGGGILPILTDFTLSGDNERVVYLLNEASPEVGTFTLE